MSFILVKRVLILNSLLNNNFEDVTANQIIKSNKIQIQYNMSNMYNMYNFGMVWYLLSTELHPV